MGLADILVHIDHYESSADRLDVAVGLAARHHARLTGLLVTRQHHPADAAADAARQLFDQRLAKAGIEGRWRCMDGSAGDSSIAEIITWHSHCSDLVVVGQGSKQSASVGIPADLPERVVLAAGRPVLVIPYAGSFVSVGERILVAWKAGRESTRAVHDALPLLKEARRIEILAKPETGEEEGSNPCSGICAHLARHGIHAKANDMIVANTLVGDVLLNRVCDESFDLLVMGAFARGHEGRLTLGSVAHHLLREMTVPVLMSH